VPESGLAAYASTPLPKKLGIKEGSIVALVGAREGSRSTGCRKGRWSGVATAADVT
jgi:hypothetical protein